MTPSLNPTYLIIGGGPGGLAPLLAASKNGSFPTLLAGGLVIVEKSATLGAGELHRFVITSDSSAETFLSCVIDNPIPELAAIAHTRIAQEMATYGKGAVPLKLAAELMDLVGKAFTTIIRNAPNCAVLTQTKCNALRRRSNGTWSADLLDLATGRSSSLSCETILSATGGVQNREALRNTMVAGAPLLPRHDARVMLSGDLVSDGGIDALKRRLANASAPRIAIIGGSTSALACTNLILTEAAERLGPGAISLLHRESLTVFYPSREAAKADAYECFDEDDICQVSGFVHRFGGFRFDSRELMRRILGLPGTEHENRVAPYRLPTRGDLRPDPVAQSILNRADIIIVCTGYRPRGMTVYDETGKRIRLCSEAPNARMVDVECAILDAQSRPIPGLFGIGLAAGYRPPKEMGGEKRFHGQVNGLWLWQNDIGARLAGNMIAYANRGTVTPLRRSLTAA